MKFIKRFFKNYNKETNQMILDIPTMTLDELRASKAWLEEHRSQIRPHFYKNAMELILLGAELKSKTYYRSQL